MALVNYGFKRKYHVCGIPQEVFHEGLCVQLAMKFFCLETFMVYSMLTCDIGCLPELKMVICHRLFSNPFQCMAKLGTIRLDMLLYNFSGRIIDNL